LGGGRQEGGESMEVETGRDLNLRKGADRTYRLSLFVLARLDASRDGSIYELR
jgi:hypothetical protein